MNCDPDVGYNRRIRKRLSNWVSFEKDYHTFLDGTHLLVSYYAWDDILKADYWTLLEVYRRWSNVIEASFFYENKYQINNFVPFAKEHLDAVFARLLYLKRMLTAEQKDSPKNWRLDARQVKTNIDALKVFEHYLPDIKKCGSRYKATCLWHDDGKPSLVVYQDGWAHCFACNVSHDVFSIIMDREKCDFATSVSIAKELGG